jgi:hypothetical protein
MGDVRNLSLEAVKRFIAAYDTHSVVNIKSSSPGVSQFEIRAAKARRDELVAMPSLPDDRYFDHILPAELVYRILYYTKNGSVAARVCKRWNAQYRTRPALIQIRYSTRFMASMTPWKYTIDTGFPPYGLIAGSDRKLWMGGVRTDRTVVISIDPVTKAIQEYPHPVGKGRLIGASAEGVPIFGPGNYIGSIVHAISETQILVVRKDRNVYDVNPVTNSKTLVMGQKAYIEHTRYFSNGVGLYVIRPTAGKGSFIRYSTLEIVPIAPDRHCSSRWLPIPGSDTALSYGGDTDFENDIDPEIAVVLRRAVHGTFIGKHLVLLDTDSIITIYS